MRRGKESVGGEADFDSDSDVYSSPFLSTDDEQTVLERVKLVMLAPIALARAVCIITISAVLALACSSLMPSAHSPDQPLPALRRHAITACTRMCAFLAIVAAGIVPITKGMHNMCTAKRNRAICVFNHLSYLDILVLVFCYGGTFLAKAGVDSVPLVGTVAKAMQAVFVERAGTSDRSSAGRSSGTSALLAQRARDPRFPMCFVAPEATTHTGKCLLRFQKGAFVSGLPVAPVLLRYPRRRRQFNPAWGVTDTLVHLYRCACQLITPVEIRVLPLYWPTESEKANPREYAENVRALMSRELEVPLCDQGVEECQALLDRGITAINGRVVYKDPMAVKAAAAMQGDAATAMQDDGNEPAHRRKHRRVLSDESDGKALREGENEPLIGAANGDAYRLAERREHAVNGEVRSLEP